MVDKPTYLAVFDVPRRMRLDFLVLVFEACPPLWTESELAMPSEGQAFDSGVGVLISDDDVNVGTLVPKAAPPGLGVGVLEGGSVGGVCSPSLRPAKPGVVPMDALLVCFE